MSSYVTARQMSAPASCPRPGDTVSDRRCGVVTYRGCRSLPLSANLPKPRSARGAPGGGWGGDLCFEVTHTRGTAQRASAVAYAIVSLPSTGGGANQAPNTLRPAHHNPGELTGSPSRRAILDRKVMLARSALREAEVEAKATTRGFCFRETEAGGGTGTRGRRRGRRGKRNENGKSGRGARQK